MVSMIEYFRFKLVKNSRTITSYLHTTESTRSIIIVAVNLLSSIRSRNSES